MSINYPKWLREEPSKRKIADKQEKHLAKKLGAKRTINSGAFDISKGDLFTDKHLIEAKYTDKDQYILKYATLEKIAKEAFESGKDPALILLFRKYNKHYLIIPLSI